MSWRSSTGRPPFKSWKKARSCMRSRSAFLSRRRSGQVSDDPPLPRARQRTMGDPLTIRFGTEQEMSDGADAASQHGKNPAPDVLERQLKDQKDYHAVSAKAQHEMVAVLSDIR